MTLVPADEAISAVLESGAVEPVGRIEEVALMEALGRVLARDVVAREDLPSFARSTVDGYAVRASDTFGATEGSPGFLSLAGEVEMGKPAAVSVGPGQAVKIPTGGMLPPGADAVVMLEHVDLLSGGTEIELTKGAAPGENVVKPGEDIRRGSVALRAGRRIRPFDLAILAGLGAFRVHVYGAPTVGIISSGDELVPYESVPGPGQVRDVNSAVLGGLVSEDGGIPFHHGIAPDDRESLTAAVRASLEQRDITLVSGGSSVGSRDLTAEVIQAMGPPGVLIKGIALRPGKPTIAGVGRDRSGRKKPIFGLPGHPASAMVVYLRVVRPVLLKMSGEARVESLARIGRGTVTARMARNVSSPQGREDFLRVKLCEREGALWAEPIRGGSAIASTLSRAGGFVRIPPLKDGLAQGEEVQVIVY